VRGYLKIKACLLRDGRKSMKKIEAVISQERLEAVVGELKRHGLGSGLTLIEVRHREKNEWLFPIERRALEKCPQRMKLELIVEDGELKNVVNIILRRAQEEGGQIVVLEVDEILRI
jgi:nitrogen regulatory protein PII